MYQYHYVDVIYNNKSRLHAYQSGLFPDTATTKAKPALDLQTKDVILTDVTNHVVRYYNNSNFHH